MRSRGLGDSPVEKGLAPRLILTIVLCSLLTVPFVGIAVSSFVVETMLRNLEPQVEPSLRIHDAECHEDPTTFAARLGRATTYALDPATGRSLNPSAPPVPAGLVAEASETGKSVFRLVWDGPGRRGGWIVTPRGEGPCGVLAITWAPEESVRRGGLLRGLGGAAVAIGLALVIALGVGLRPLLVRLRRLGGAAIGVGGDDYGSAADDGEDVLGEISRLLDGAHGRIRADAERLESSRRALERHLADVAHDLRTPLAALSLNLSETRRRVDDPEVRARLASAVEDVVYLTALTKNLRLASRLREGVDPGREGMTADLTELVDRVADRFALLGRERSIEVVAGRPDDPVPVACDPTMVEQILANLVHNGVKYGDEGGHVAVLLDGDPSGFELQVLDDGPGVPPAVLPRLGERTFRTDDARSRDEDGTGLGLSIVGEVCARMGWQLTFEPHAPRGLRVRIAGGDRQ